MCWTRWAGPLILGVELPAKEKQETRNIGGGAPAASPMPKSILFVGRKRAQLLRGRVFVRTFHEWGDMVFIIGDYVNFPCWMVIQYFPY